MRIRRRNQRFALFALAVVALIAPFLTCISVTPAAAEYARSWMPDSHQNATSTETFNKTLPFNWNSSALDVSEQGSAIAQASTSCLPPTYWSLESFPINTQENLCMYNSQGDQCNFSVAYGTIFGQAFSKLLLGSGDCYTNGIWSGNNSVEYCVNAGVPCASSSRGPFGFGGWNQINGGEGSSVTQGLWTVCMLANVSVPSDGTQCLTLVSVA
jgi:hypothetical protein